MSTGEWLLAALLGALAVYALLVLALVVAGRRDAARGLAGFIPDCVVLFRRLLAEEQLTRRHRLLVVALIGYLALPFDLVPDFIPVAGQLDDAVLLALVLRGIVRGAGAAVVAEHWPGPAGSLQMVLKLAGGHV